ncbi:hypothetical protein PVAND_013494 [Polypedilum vanderplanki]|uniref:RRM domain-containing protein n=1 Tax=Polypedilum vanderplanki TaxID=319348 RepID=A0A9J6CPM0_POLVA|nr:hypothetical protein PVAND_013494 [Polypedilum vanderplanki]
MLSQPCIMVCQEFGDEPIEIPIERDNTVLLTTVTSNFPNATGLKFRNPLNNCMRAVKIENNKFYPPMDDGWCHNKIQYLCVFPKPSDENLAASPTPSSSLEKDKELPTSQKSQSTTSGSSGAQPKTVDLIVLNLSPNTTENELRQYFEEDFGPLLMVELKRDRKTGSSRRFAFIRFKNYKDQMRALGQIKHKIDGHHARLALPDFRDPSELYQENKCFIGRVNENIKPSDLKDFFSQFGDIVEVSYPKKFKGYAFITFADAEVARRVCGQDFIVKGYSLCVSKSTHGTSNNNKNNQQQQQQHNYQDFTQQDWSNGWFQAANTRQDWMQPPQKYMTAPLNPGYGNSLMGANVNPMVNALSIAMSNMMNKGFNNQNYRMNPGGNWNQQQRPNDNNNKTKKNKKKTKNTNKKKDELSKRLESQGDDDDADKNDDEEDSNSAAENGAEEEALKQK